MIYCHYVFKRICENFQFPKILCKRSFSQQFRKTCHRKFLKRTVLQKIQKMFHSKGICVNAKFQKNLWKHSISKGFLKTFNFQRFSENIQFLKIFCQCSFSQQFLKTCRRKFLNGTVSKKFQKMYHSKGISGNAKFQKEFLKTFNSKGISENSPFEKNLWMRSFSKRFPKLLDFKWISENIRFQVNFRNRYFKDFCNGSLTKDIPKTYWKL